MLIAESILNDDPDNPLSILKTPFSARLNPRRGPGRPPRINHDKYQDSSKSFTPIMSSSNTNPNN